MGNYDNGKARENFCLNKMESILKSRFIYRPCDFKINGISHDDCASLYTHYYTFVACHPESIYAARFKKDIKEDDGFTVATKYSKFGILLDSRLLDELTIDEDTFCDKEVLIADNISIDEYGTGIYINPMTISDESYQALRSLIRKYGYSIDVIDVFDGAVVQALDEEQEKVKRLMML